jgi:ankyrin repeat protein
MNKKDFHGNTILSLSAKLAKYDSEYLKLVNFLLKQGANPKIKDHEGWTVLDEAISTQNTNLLTLVFDGMNSYKK